MVIQNPCSFCKKGVHNNHKSIFCDYCEQWIHYKCNLLNLKEYNKLEASDDDETWYCINCIPDIFPFTRLNDNEFYLTSVEGKDDYNFENIVFATPLQKAQYTKLNTYINEKINLLQDDNDNDTNDEFDVDPSIDCQYYNFDDFLKAKFQPKKSFSILHLNIHSIQKHFDEFSTALDMLNFKFDVIAISESLLIKGKNPIVDFHLDGYHPPIGTPTESSKGGVLMYISDSLKYIERPKLNIYESKHVESLFVEIKNHKSKNNIVGVVYRHPSSNELKFNDVLLRNLLFRLNNENNKNIFIAGDFNFDLIKASTHQPTSDFYDMLSTNFLLPTILLPTKINSVADTLIDNIFTNFYNPNIISGNLTLSISDHLPSFAIFPNSNNDSVPKKHNIFKRDFRKLKKPEEINKFKDDFNAIDWNDTLQISRKDINSSFNNFYDTFTGILDRYAPIKRMKNRDLKSKIKPWINQEVKVCMKQRDIAYGKYVRSKDPTAKASLHDRYKVLRNQATQKLRRSKYGYFKNYFIKNSGNIKNLWKGINQIVNVKSKSYDYPTHMEDKEGKSIDSPADISNHFNDYFSNIAQSILDNRKYTGDGNFEKYLSSPSQNSLILSKVTASEVSEIIKAFDANKACGPISIPTDILKLLVDYISPIIAQLIDLSFEGTHPERLKSSKVMPAFKKSSKIKASNYRPISLLSNINKIFEKVMYGRVFAFIDGQNYFYKLQYGFRAKHSTEHALINLTEQIKKSLDIIGHSESRKYACGVFVDFQKAFDTVNHEILLKKLEYYGIRGPVNDWFKSYLHERKQYVSILGFDSEELIMQHGVPQGSVLGPLLFLLYINDLNKAILNSTVYHFADDTNMLMIDSSYKLIQKKLNIDLKCLVNWLLANKISLNTAKTELIFFRKPGETVPKYIKIKINGHRIYPSSYIKYLGVYLDEYLDGSAHCFQLQSKLRRSIGMISKVKHYLTPSELNSFYHATFSSNLLYGSQIWGITSLNIINQIKVLQNRAVKLISQEYSDILNDILRERETTEETNDQRTDTDDDTDDEDESNDTFEVIHVTPFYHSLKLLKFEDNITLKNCLFVHDFLNNKLPEAFTDYFTLCSETSSTATRQISRGALFQPNVNTVKYGVKSIHHQSILAWNQMIQLFPNHMLSSLSKLMLKRMIKEHFISSYNAENPN